MLSKNKSLLDTMARLLVERETIFSEEVDMIMDGKTVEEIIEFMDENERSLSKNPFERAAAKPQKSETAEVVEEKETTENTDKEKEDGKDNND